MTIQQAILADPCHTRMVREQGWLTEGLPRNFFMIIITREAIYVSNIIRSSTDTF